MDLAVKKSRAGGVDVGRGGENSKKNRPICNDIKK